MSQKPVRIHFFPVKRWDVKIRYKDGHVTRLFSVETAIDYIMGDTTSKLFECGMYRDWSEVAEITITEET